MARYPAPEDPVGNFGRYLHALLGSIERPLVFDVGGNRGHTVRRLKRILPSCEVHTFEPSPAMFAELVRTAGEFDRVHPVNLALGASRGSSLLMENTVTEMSSLLKRGSEGWGEIVQKTPVEVETLDSYCASRKLSRIDLLKVDTQGFELEVLRGAERLIAEHRVGAVFCEAIFCDMYEGRPEFDDLYRLLRAGGFRLVSFYDWVIKDGLAGWADVLFVHPGACPPPKLDLVSP